MVACTWAVTVPETSTVGVIGVFVDGVRAPQAVAAARASGMTNQRADGSANHERSPRPQSLIAIRLGRLSRRGGRGGDPVRGSTRGKPRSWLGRTRAERGRRGR